MNSNTIWAVGSNYKDHIQEMKAERPHQPLFFLKSAGCLTKTNKVQIPSFSQDLHHELEVAVQIQNLKPHKVALALDLTARDIQAQAKAKGHPWTLAKSFKNSCPISPWVDYQNANWFESLEFSLFINDKKTQHGKTSDMVFRLEELLNFLFKHYPAQDGDILLTGTPAGVGSLKKGDQIRCELNSLIQWELVCEAAPN